MFRRLYNNVTKPKLFNSVKEIELKYDYDFSDIKVENSFILDTFNNIVSKYNKYNIDECLMILYYYYTYLTDEVFIELFKYVKNYDKDIRKINYLQDEVIRLIRLEARFQKRKENYISMIACYEKGIQQYDPICMLKLSDFFKKIDINMYIKYKEMYFTYKKDKKYYDLYLLFKEVNKDEKAYTYIFDGINNSELICFNTILEYYGNSEEKLKFMFMKIAKMKNTMVEENLFRLTDKIKKYDPLFIENLSKDKKNIEDYFPNYDNYIMYIFDMVGKIIFI